MSVSNKLFNDLTTEDLLLLAQTDSNNKTKMSEGERFVMAHNIVDGDYKVSVTLLFKLYQSWTKTPVSKIKFFSGIAKKFKKNRTAMGNVGYHVAIEPFEELIITGKAVLLGKTIYAKEEIKKRIKNKKKKNKKISSKVSNVGAE